MQLSHKNLTAHLQHKLLPLYWFSGDEQLLLAEAVDSLCFAAKQQGFEQHDIYHVDANFDWEQLMLAANTLSLFADKAIIEIRLGDKSLADTAKKKLQHYVNSPAPDKIILISSNKLASTTLKTKWFKEIEKNAAVMQIWPLTPAELPYWIKTRAQKFGLALELDAVRLLTDLGEGNLLSLQQAIEKLNLLYPNETITVEKIKAAISDNARFNLFSLADAALAADRKRSLRILQGLKYEGTEAILILWALVREIRMLATINEVNEFNDVTLRANGVWPNRMSLVKKALSRQPKNHWQNLLTIAFTIDLIIKGAEVGNVWDELEGLVLKI